MGLENKVTKGKAENDGEAFHMGPWEPQKALGLKRVVIRPALWEEPSCYCEDEGLRNKMGPGGPGRRLEQVWKVPDSKAGGGREVVFCSDVGSGEEQQMWREEAELTCRGWPGAVWICRAGLGANLELGS